MAVRKALLHAALGAACIGLIGLYGSAAWAADDDNGASDQSTMSKFLQTIGLRPAAVTDSANIRYTERPPLVVPPTRDLPAPGATGSVPTTDWPTEPKTKHNKAPKPKVADPATPPPANPNPPFVKKTWYNPATWFNKEEYATFSGEPAREYLTDPPIGYRTPSPEQPYGIGPEKKSDYKPTGADMNMTPAGH